MDEAVKLPFEQIFIKHYERLTNAKQSVGGLPFTMENLVCFILLGGRELDIEDIYGDISERYSMEEFLADAKDAGIEADDLLKKTIADMIAHKFLHRQPDGRFYSYQATRDTARMLNRIYPKMEGLSLLAYIGQTIQEVESGRIELESALSRFDQTLQHQGVPLPKPKIPVITPPPKPVTPAKKIEESRPTSRSIIRDYIVTDPAAKAKADLLQAPAGDAPPAPEKKPDPVRPPVKKAPEPPVAEPEALPEVVADEALTPEEEALPAVFEKDMVIDDEDIAAKVAAFEKELALVCPICKTSVLTEKTTAAGKVFYTCTSEACNFISWGRPHHIQCARCKNPFMVEVEDANKQLILKCPRATCQHRQPLAPSGAPPAGTVRKVVRKRLVRRKA
ncbi:MAG: hypothetical protein R6W75_03180 [Smithellaceae bacterium]